MSAVPEAEPSGFHTRNDPSNPFQRDNIIDRNKGHIIIQSEHVDVAHGFMSEDSDDACSLVVVAFRFDPNGVARRIKEAQIVITFAALERGKEDPEVVGMEPNGTLFIEPTVQHETNTVGGAIKASGAGAEIKLLGSHTVERDTTDSARVRGSIDLRNRKWGGKNSVSWSLLENATAKSGVVTRLQAAILLKRRDTAHFKATVTVRVVADTWTALGSVFKAGSMNSGSDDDDVWYNPDRKPPSTDRLQKYDVDNLGHVDLKLLSDVAFRTLRVGSIREG
ncbi:hypothetical protein B0T26DRAFT_637089 [Lasiosphaeria miniovina]|uniref:Uncharacterized protein n=1 Tax=Lasiosphaeria miniovina TaxID=1954250 RepID=A0AA40E9Z6_9PEZI|nr:uncharacterized protein B0T26DRAFT_637089 [Lasiosphaeria miniovina]KAK0727788.1 hypothetical protein B0T26DRAFT_637089 [Lasiosphaeria miniovina]